MKKVNNSKEISAKEFAEICNSKEISREELQNVSGGCGKKVETITVYCTQCDWETQWTGDFGNNWVFIGPCPVCGARNIYKRR